VEDGSDSRPTHLDPSSPGRSRDDEGRERVRQGVAGRRIAEAWRP
jgi:hypothetical protein